MCNCDFSVHFFDEQWLWASLHVLIYHLYIFFDKVSIFFPSLLGCLFSIINCQNYTVNIKCVYIQNINTLLVIYLTLVIYKILQVSFEEQKLFIVMMSKFSPFLLRMCFWYHMLKKNNHLIQRHIGFLLYTLLEVLYV